MINCTLMFRHQIEDLARAVQNACPANTTNAMVQQGFETRRLILDTLREHGPMTSVAIGRMINRSRAATHSHLARMSEEHPPRVRKTQEGYNTPWELA